MNNAAIRWLLLASLAFLGGCSDDSETGSIPDRPNVLLIMSDDQGWGDTGYNGHPYLQTPNLDALRAAGMSFDHFYSAAPVCSPTRASVVTGRHPKRMGIDNPNEGRLRDEEITIAEIARSLGYVTAHFGKWHLGTMTTDIRDSNRGAPGNIADFGPPWRHGYDIAFATEAKVPTFDPMRDPENPDEWYGTAYWLGEGDAVPYDDPTLAGDDSRVIVDRLIPFIESQVDNERPFFATVWLHSPHDPVVADPDDPVYADNDALTDGQKTYYSVVTKLDHEVGRIVRALDTLGIAQDTLVAFTSDNGASERFAGSNGHFRGYKQDVYEGGIRVPSLLVWPGVIPAGSSSDVPAITHDYMPTLLDIWNAEDRFPADRPLDGRSLMPLVRGEDVPARQLAFAFTRWDADDSDALPQRMALVAAGHKLVSYDYGKTWQLYDLNSDPSETTDIAMTNGTRVSDMRLDLLAWFDDTRSSREGRDYGRD